MSIAAYITQGCGPGATIALYTTSGLGIGAAVEPEPEIPAPPIGGGGAITRRPKFTGRGFFDDDEKPQPEAVETRPAPVTDKPRIQGQIGIESLARDQSHQQARDDRARALRKQREAKRREVERARLLAYLEAEDAARMDAARIEAIRLDEQDIAAILELEQQMRVEVAAYLMRRLQ